MNTNADQILSRLAAGNLKARQAGKAAVRKKDRVLSIALLTCADERIVPEVLFDQPPGAFYTVRIAGNVYSPEAAGSLEVAVVRHRCPLVLVLGHTGCSAVALALSKDRVEGSLYELSRRIRPVVAALPPDATYEQAVEANVLNTVRELRERCRGLREREERGELKIAGAVYDLETGAVRMVG